MCSVILYNATHIGILYILRSVIICSINIIVCEYNYLHAVLFSESLELCSPKPPSPLTPPAPRRNTDFTGAGSFPISHTIDDFTKPEIQLRPVKK